MYIYAMHMASGRSRPGYQIQATAINQATVETVPDPQPAVPQQQLSFTSFFLLAK